MENFWNCSSIKSLTAEVQITMKDYGSFGSGESSKSEVCPFVISSLKRVRVESGGAACTCGDMILNFRATFTNEQTVTLENGWLF